MNVSCRIDLLSTNSVTPEWWEISEDRKTAALSTAVFTLLFIITGLPSNILIISSILYRRLYREPTHILLLNLAVTDLLVCVCVMPFTVVSGFAGGFVLGGSDSVRCEWCKTGVIFVGLGLVSLHTLALLSVDRFVFIKFPLKYDLHVTWRKAVLCVGILWIVSILLAVPPVFGFGNVVFFGNVATCTISPRSEDIGYLVFLLAESCFPFGAFIVANTWLVCIVQKHIRKTYSNLQQSPPDNRQQASQRN